MLESEILHGDDAGRGAPVLVLMHGRGADPSDLVPLRRVLPPELTLVLPQAPHAGLPWGYGSGWAWYRYEGDTRPETETFRASQSRLESFLESLPDRLGYEPGPVLLGGFSQGGTMALGFGLRHPGRVEGVLVFSGFLPDHPDVRVTADTVSGTAIWWGHGTSDPAIRHDWAQAGRATLRAAGADLESRDYVMGHGISPEEIRDAVSWLEPRIRAPAG